MVRHRHAHIHIHIHLVARERCVTAEYRVVADADAVEAAVEVESGCWFVRMHPSIRAVDVFIRVAPAEKDTPAMHLYLSHL
jgi:hypothetical protein